MVNCSITRGKEMEKGQEMNKRKILLRFDDICPTMNWKQWNKAKSLLDSIGATALLGVIPNNQDPDLLINEPREDFWEYIKQLQQQGYTIAMHGYQHVFDINASGLSTPKKHSEFAGHTYEEQNRRICEGKRILKEHGIETDVFFAPAHSYDDNTLKALAANGFKYVSDGKSQKPYKRHGIICFPEYTGGLPSLKNEGDYYTAVLHAHEWVRPGGERTWERLKELSLNPSNDMVSFKEYTKQTCGSPYVQHMYEWCYVKLATLKHTILR